MLKSLKLLNFLLITSSVNAQDISIYDSRTNKGNVVVETCYEKRCYLIETSLDKLDIDKYINQMEEIEDARTFYIPTLDK